MKSLRKNAIGNSQFFFCWRNIRFKVYRVRILYSVAFKYNTADKQGRWLSIETTLLKHFKPYHENTRYRFVSMYLRWVIMDVSGPILIFTGQFWAAFIKPVGQYWALSFLGWFFRARGGIFNVSWFPYFYQD